MHLSPTSPPSVSSHKGWCWVGVSSGVPSTLSTLITGLLICGVMTCLAYLSPPLAQGSNNGSFIIVFLTSSTRFSTQETIPVYLLTEQMNGQMKAVTTPSFSLSHYKNIPYFTPAVFQSRFYKWALLYEVLENSETPEATPETWIPVVWDGALASVCF